MRAESTFESMDEEVNQNQNNLDYEPHPGYERAAGRPAKGGPSAAKAGPASLTGHGDAAVGDGSRHDPTDWEDWEEFPIYNILLTLLRLFWEMLLTL